MNPALGTLVVVAALALSVGGGWAVTVGVLRAASRSSDAGDSDQDSPVGEQATSALRGGTWIGLLERLAVTGLILAGENTGVAVVVAVKGLGRFPELKQNPAASERFVIGSLASLGWAAAVGAAGRVLLLGS